MFKSAIIVGAMIIMPGMSLSGDEITVQGTELIRETVIVLEKVVEQISAMEYEQVIVSAEQAGELWKQFVDNHAYVFENELTPSEEIPELLSVITLKIETVTATCKEMVESRDIRVIHATIDELNELKGYCAVPVLMDFTGASCKSCKVMKERLQAVADQIGGSARVVIIDVNSQKKYSKRFKIMLIPTLVFIDNQGKEVERHVGEMEVQAVIAQLSKMSE